MRRDGDDDTDINNGKAASAGNGWLLALLWSRGALQRGGFCQELLKAGPPPVAKATGEASHWRRGGLIPDLQSVESQ